MPAKPRRAWRAVPGALLATALLAAAGHAAAWFWLCDRLEKGFAAWAAARAAAGWRVEHGPPRRGGWPLSASLTLPGFRVEGGAGLLPGGVDWRAEALTLRLSPPRLDRLALEAPGLHRVRLGEAELPPLAAARLDAALPLRPGDGGLPDEAAATARGVRFGAAVEVASASLDFDARPGGGGRAMTLRASAAGVALPPGLPGADRLGRVVDRIGMDLALTGAVPPVGDPARRAAAWRDRGGALEARALDARWGEAAASAVATLALDGALQPAGTGTLRLAGGEALLDAARDAGLLPPFTAAAAAFALRALSRQPPEGGGPARAELPLALRDRALRLGPVVLGRLPAVEWDAAGPGSRAGRP